MLRILVVLAGCAAMAWPAGAAMAGDFWLKAKGSGCQVWSDDAPTAADVVTWSGACKDGKAAGTGKLNWTRAGKPYAVYEGAMAGGKLNGYGVLQLAVKGGFDTYEGAFKNGEVQGSIAYRNAKGDIYEGGVKDGKPHGTGYRKTGDEEYLGAFVDGARDGVGLWITPRMSYLGEFKGDTASGSGVLEEASGSRYHGQFRDGKPHGAGTYTTGAGAVYQGVFKNGKADGPFLVTAKPGAKPVLETWKDGKKVK